MKNFRTYQLSITLYKELKGLKVPAVRAMALVGGERVLETLKSYGVSSLMDADYYGPALALGAIDMSLWDLSHAYLNLTDNQKLFSILSNPDNRRRTFGTNSILNLPFAAAVKTGTSKDMRDNWCIGWTDKYLVGVWVGNFDGSPMWNVSGVSGAAPIWHELMVKLHTELPKNDFPIYLKPKEVLPQAALSKIHYPVTDMLVGLDPDIPARLQKLPIEIKNPQKHHRVFVDGKYFSNSQATLLWPIRLGRHTVELREKSGRVLEKIKFEVR